MDVSEHIMGILETMNKKNRKEDWNLLIERRGDYIHVQFSNYSSRDTGQISRTGYSKLEGSFQESLLCAIRDATSPFEYEVGGDGDEVYLVEKQLPKMNFGDIQEVTMREVEEQREITIPDHHMIIINVNKD